MKFLLAAINAKYIHSNLAVYSLRAYAKKHGLSVGLLEFTINQPADYILKTIYLEKPDAVFFSCYIWNIDYVEVVVKNLYLVSPGTRIFLGGPEVSFDAQEVMRRMPFLAGVLTGEGEETFLQLLKGDWENLAMGKTYESIPVLMDELPFVYEQMDMRDMEHRILYYESSRGCPFSCSYCLSSVDKRLRFRSLSLVEQELQFFIDSKVPQVKFVDRTFNCDKERALAIFKYIVEHDRGVTNFHFEIAADLVTKEQLQVMAAMRPGLIQLEIGVQSTNPKTLKAIRRTMDFLQVSRIVKEIGKGDNIHQHLDLIAGLPYEDYASFQKSFCDVYALRPNQLQLGFLKVLKGSYMQEQAEAYDCRCRQNPPYEVLATRWISYEEIIKLKSVDKMVDIYYNSGQFTRTLPLFEEAFCNPFDFFGALGDFYGERGYEAISHSRVRRYDILLEFAAACNEGFENCQKSINMDILRERMTVDLYLREKMKKVPAWAVDLRDICEFDYEHRDPLTGNAIMTQKE